jgi:hypothetical protein
MKKWKFKVAKSHLFRNYAQDQFPFTRNLQDLRKFFYII